jgi:hypothetical protein
MNTSSYPKELLSLISSKGFAELASNEKELVLHWFSEEEYRDMRSTYLSIRAAEKATATTLEPRPATKEVLLEKFRQRQQKPLIIKMTQYRIPVWQAAAAVILLSCLALLFPKNPKHSVALNTVKHDTVVVEKTKIEKQLAYDTVYISKAETGSHKPAKASDFENRVAVKTSYSQSHDALPASVGQVRIMNLGAKDNVQSGGKSLEEDDSKERTFGYVSM